MIYPQITQISADDLSADYADFRRFFFSIFYPQPAQSFADRFSPIFLAYIIHSLHRVVEIIFPQYW